VKEDLMTRRLVLAAALVAAGASLPAQGHVVFRDPTAETLFKTSRNAAGGEGAISGLESPLLRGTAKVAEDDGGPDEREVEMRILLPDGIVRIDTAPGYEKRAGFYLNSLLTSIRTGGGVETPPAQMRAALIKAERARMGRLLLGMAAVPIRPGWLTLRSLRSAVTTTDPRTTMGTDDPTGAGTSLTAERAGQRVLEGSAQDGFYIRLFFNAASLPFRIQYEAGRGTQVATEFSDRRRVSGLLLPYRIVTSTGGRVVDDFTIREIVVNPRLTPADFER
jgi:hypothetical protein